MVKLNEEERYITDLIAQGEHQQLDFKFEISNARKIARSLVAFANTDGGRLLIGVKDNGRIAGIRSEEEYYMIDAAASMYCKPEIPFESFHRVVQGKQVLEVVVNASSLKPHYARDESNRWVAYLRVDDENILANWILLQVWKRQNRIRGTFITYSEQEKQVLNHLQGGPSVTISTLKAATGIRKRVLSHILINLVSLGVVKMSYREKDFHYELEDPEADLF